MMEQDCLPWSEEGSLVVPAQSRKMCWEKGDGKAITLHSGGKGLKYKITCTLVPFPLHNVWVA